MPKTLLRRLDGTLAILRSAESLGERPSDAEAVDGGSPTVVTTVVNGVAVSDEVGVGAANDRLRGAIPALRNSLLLS